MFGLNPRHTNETNAILMRSGVLNWLRKQQYHHFQRRKKNSVHTQNSYAFKWIFLLMSKWTWWIPNVELHQPKKTRSKFRIKNKREKTNDWPRSQNSWAKILNTFSGPSGRSSVGFFFSFYFHPFIFFSVP